MHQLPDCIGNPPPPHRRAGIIAIQGQLLHPYRAFRLGLIAVAFQHQVGDAPDVARKATARTSIGGESAREGCLAFATGDRAVAGQGWASWSTLPATYVL